MMKEGCNFGFHVSAMCLSNFDDSFLCENEWNMIISYTYDRYNEICRTKFEQYGSNWKTAMRVEWERQQKHKEWVRDEGTQGKTAFHDVDLLNVSLNAEAVGDYS